MIRSIVPIVDANFLEFASGTSSGLVGRDLPQRPPPLSGAFFREEWCSAPVSHGRYTIAAP
jgi:hypothetical protein